MSEHLCNTVSQSIKPSHFLSKACLKKYLVVSHRITIIYNMGSYKLYVAVMAIASIVAVQVKTNQLLYRVIHQACLTPTFSFDNELSNSDVWNI